MAMPMGFARLLERKYDIMQQREDTTAEQVKVARIGTEAAAALDRARAGVIPAESMANIGLTKAQTGLTDANTDMARKNTSWIDRLNAMGLRVSEANIGETKARTGLLGAQTVGETQMNQRRRLAPRSPWGDSSDLLSLDNWLR